jgi:integrase/recombinase XerC
LGTRDWTKAQERLRELETTGVIAKPAPANVNRATIETLQELFIQNKQTENLSYSTIKQYKILFRQLVEFARVKGIRYVDELDLVALQEFRNTWKLQSSTKSIRQGNLQSILKFALTHKWIPENPAMSLGKIKVYRTQKLPFTDDEMQRISTAAKVDPKGCAFILTMRYSGLRISDVAQLRVTSLESTNHLVLRTAKTGTPVKVLLQRPEVANALRAIKPVHDYFFWNGRSSTRSNADYWRAQRLIPILEAAGIERAHAHPHRFRHTFAVNLLKRGTPVGVVATLLGNSEGVVRKYYSAWVVSRQQGLDEAVADPNDPLVL